MLRKTLSLLVLLSSFALATEPRTAVRSSFTATDDSVAISGARFLTAVVVGTVSVGGTLSIFDSTHTAANQIAVIALDDIETHDFRELKVKGIFYDSLLNDGVTILFRK